MDHENPDYSGGTGNRKLCFSKTKKKDEFSFFFVTYDELSLKIIEFFFFPFLKHSEIFRFCCQFIHARIGNRTLSITGRERGRLFYQSALGLHMSRNISRRLKK